MLSASGHHLHEMYVRTCWRDDSGRLHTASACRGCPRLSTVVEAQEAGIPPAEGPG